MKKWKKLIIVIVLIILIVLFITFLTFYVRRNKEIKNVNQELTLLDASKKYFFDNDVFETSLETLFVNNYIDNYYEYNKCTIIKKEELKITDNIDCEKSANYSIYPVILVNAFNVDGNTVDLLEWHKNDVVIKFDFLETEHSKYKESDIKKVSWMDLDGNVLSNERDFYVKGVNGVTDIRLSIEFENLYYNKIFNIKIDDKAPILLNSSIINNYPFAFYEDDFLFDKVFYFASKYEINKFDKSMFSIKQINYNCGEDYFIYSYAKDLAGNESEISYLGKVSYVCNNGSLYSKDIEITEK
ncbi:MAG: hypothetical protein RSF02_03345 [Bacilli bacterium]